MELYSIYATLHQGEKKTYMKHTPFLHNDEKGINSFIEKNKDRYDVFNTVSYYKGKKHATDEIAFLYRIIVDIDQHFSGITKEEAEEFVRVAQKDFGKSFPTPTKINYSGRGIHIYIDIENSTDLQKYQLVENHLQTIFDNFIGEHFPLWNASIDRRNFYNRLIRVEGTINTKAQAYCENIFKTSNRYELDNLIQAYISDLSEIVGEGLKQRAKTEKLHRAEFKTHKREFKGYRKGFTAKTLQKAVLSDLEKLRELRSTRIDKERNGNYILKGNEGERNQSLFIYALYAKYYYQDTNEAYNALKCFNARFKPQPLDENELSAVFVSSLKSNYTTRKMTTIVEQLKISAEEMQQMKVLFDTNEKKRRQKERVAEQTKKLTEKRRGAKRELIAQCKELQQSGYNTSQIALNLNLDKRTVKKYLCQ